MEKQYMYSNQVKTVCEYFKDKNKIGLRKHIFYDKIKFETCFLVEKANISQRFWHVLNDTKDIPKCKECKIKQVKWHRIKKKYCNFCSVKCVGNNKEIKEKRKLNWQSKSEDEKKEFKDKCIGIWQNRSEEEKKDIRRKHKQNCLEKYGVENVMKVKGIREKHKQNCLEKYGVENVMKVKDVSNKIKQSWSNKSEDELEEIKEKIKRTYLEKYGVEYATQSEYVKKKIKETCLKKYGVESSMQLKNISNKVSIALLNKTEEEKEKIKEKVKQTSLDKYGVENAMKSKDIKKKIKETCLKKYGVDNTSQKHLSKMSLERLKNPNYLREQHYLKKKTLTEIAKELGLYGAASINHYFNKYNIPILTYSSSTAEKEVILFIKTIYKKIFTTNTRKIITPLELDAYLEDLNLAVEFNGTYWHSDKEKSKDYHFNKVKLCYEKNINLIHIYEYEWDNFKNSIKHWLEKYVTNNLENIITRDVYLKDIINKKEICLSLNWPINYDLLKKNNFKFKKILEPEEIKIKQYSIYDAGKVVYKKRET